MAPFFAKSVPTMFLFEGEDVIHKVDRLDQFRDNMEAFINDFSLDDH